MTPSRADFEWLTSSAAAPHLARAAEAAGELTRVVGALRKELSAARAHLVLEQVELRRRAQEKFSRAAEMFFTRKGLEQATDEGIARYKAGRLPLAGDAADLCSGIGGDWLALSAAARDRKIAAIAYELDPIAAHLARENHRRLLGAEGEVRVADAAQVEGRDFAYVHLDPDRRADGRRHTRFDDLTPGGEFLERCAAPAMGVKLAPATEVPAPWASAGERQWIGSRGECRQQMLWLGAAAHGPGRRAALVVDPAGETLGEVVEQPESALEPAAAVGAYLYEPHPAILAANLAASLARCASPPALRALTPDGGYLTGDQRLFWPHLVSGFVVDDVLPYDWKRVKAYLRQHGIGRLEIKKRGGVPDDPAELRRRWQVPGDRAATLLLARASSATLAIIARRIEASA
jgi:hypothetical protein